MQSNKRNHIIRWAFKAGVGKAQKDIGSFVEAMAEEDSSDANTFLSDHDQRQMCEANFTAGTVQNEEGLYEMMMALWNWGSALEDVHQPFDVLYGDADDIISREMPAHVAKRLPAATPHVWPGAGHYGFIDRARRTEVWSPLGR